MCKNALGMKALTLSVVLILAACAGNIDPSQQLDDAALATRVREALSADPSLRSYRITVDARRGAVTLTGTVPSSNLRERATSVVGGVSGVTRVENLMSVQ